MTSVCSNNTLVLLPSLSVLGLCTRVRPFSDSALILGCTSTNRLGDLMTSSSLLPGLLSHYQVLRTTDFEMHAEAMNRLWRSHRGLQRTGQGSFRSRIHLAPLAQSALAYFTFSGGVKFDASALPNAYTLALPLSGTLTFRQHREVISIHPHLGLVSTAGQDHQIWVPTSVELLNVRLDRTVVEQDLAHLLDRPVGRPLQFALDLDLRRGLGATLARLLHYVADELDQPDTLYRSSTLVVRQSERMLTTLLLENQPHTYLDELHGPALQAASWQIRRAEEYVRAHLHHPLSVADLAAAAGVSGRTLRRTFRRHRGCSPMQFVRQLRLEAVRRDLLDAASGVTVSEVALRWGFDHFGRFSAHYRQAFNEHPSETLRHRTPAAVETNIRA